MSTTPTYQPSVYYFRKALRESGTRERAVIVGLVICDEYQHLKTWAGEMGIAPAPEHSATALFLMPALRTSASHAQAILLGLFVCHELEQLKADVREAGLIPPKWIVADEEAEVKGWETMTRAPDQQAICT